MYRKGGFWPPTDEPRASKLLDRACHLELQHISLAILLHQRHQTVLRDQHRPTHTSYPHQEQPKYNATVTACWAIISRKEVLSTNTTNISIHLTCDGPCPTDVAPHRETPHRTDQSLTLLALHPCTCYLPRDTISPCKRRSWLELVRNLPHEDVPHSRI